MPKKKRRLFAFDPTEWVAEAKTRADVRRAHGLWVQARREHGVLHHISPSEFVEEMELCRALGRIGHD
jgi:hypothetical protein